MWSAALQAGRQRLPPAPLDIEYHEDEPILFQGWFFKQHRNKGLGVPRYLIVTSTLFLKYSRAGSDRLVKKTGTVLKSAISSLSFACGPRFLPGLGIVTPSGTDVYLHPDPAQIDKLFNFLVVWTFEKTIATRELQARPGGIQQRIEREMDAIKSAPQGWPDPRIYTGQLPIIEVGYCAPGGIPPYLYPAFKSDPILTPSQIASLESSRLLIMAIIEMPGPIIGRKEFRLIITNEILLILADDGSEVLRCCPNEIDEISTLDGDDVHNVINPVSIGVRARPLNLALRDGTTRRIYPSEIGSKHWGSALAAFLGVIPPKDCLYTISPFVERDRIFYAIDENIERTATTVRVRRSRHSRGEISEESSRSSTARYQSVETHTTDTSLALDADGEPLYFVHDYHYRDDTGVDDVTSDRQASNNPGSGGNPGEGPSSDSFELSDNFYQLVPYDLQESDEEEHPAEVDISNLSAHHTFTSGKRPADTETTSALPPSGKHLHGVASMHSLDQAVAASLGTTSTPGSGTIEKGHTTKKCRFLNKLERRRAQVTKLNNKHLAMIEERYHEDDDSSERPTQDSDLSTDYAERELPDELAQIHECGILYAINLVRFCFTDPERYQNPQLNTWELLCPSYASEDTLARAGRSRYALRFNLPSKLQMTDEAAQVRRRILRGYVLSLYKRHSQALVLYDFADPFGGTDEFLEKLAVILPKDLDPTAIGVPHPPQDIIDKYSMHARLELLQEYEKARNCYGEMLWLAEYILAIERPLLDDAPDDSNGNDLHQRAEDYPNSYLLQPDHPVDGEAVLLHCKTYFEYKVQRASGLTIIDLYRMLLWYATNVGVYLSRKLRIYTASQAITSACIADTVTETDLELIKSAAADMLILDALVLPPDADALIDTVVSAAEQIMGSEHESNATDSTLGGAGGLDDAELHRNNEIFAYFGHNLHIFGANEQLRRASRLIFVVFLSSIETRLLQQWGEHFADLTTTEEFLDGYQRAMQYIATAGTPYMDLMVPQHAWHILGVCYEVIDNISSQHIMQASRAFAGRRAPGETISIRMDYSKFASAFNQDALKRHRESINKFSKLVTPATPEQLQALRWFYSPVTGYIWADVKGSCQPPCILALDGGLLRCRGWAIERVTGARPNYHVAHAPFILWFNNIIILCTMYEGTLHVHRFLLVSTQDTSWIFSDVTSSFLPSSSALATLPQLIIRMDVSTLAPYPVRIFLSNAEVHTLYSDPQVPFFVTLFLLLYPLTDTSNIFAETPMTTEQYRLVTYNAPLDSSGLSDRQHDDAEDGELFTQCDPMPSRPLINKDAELEAARSVFPQAKVYDSTHNGSPITQGPDMSGSSRITRGAQLETHDMHQ
ncbi:hypothetical protein GMRT_10275 [Giardia muris]|uniref:Uncharacterized protein n=1 Tax=Giardia muris TaxID=5742 RepID=A0A4Z1T5V1_GIAMU|nr:hypothetical protein GMRT_10275 [Giardia muris]|eukprot:TNJ29433.1 hypothetical protein GMRT_10275 [Giardia muris]